MQQYDPATINAAVKIIDGYIQKTIFAGDAARLRHAKADILKLLRPS